MSTLVLSISIGIIIFFLVLGFIWWMVNKIDWPDTIGDKINLMFELVIFLTVIGIVMTVVTSLELYY